MKYDPDILKNAWYLCSNSLGELKCIIEIVNFYKTELLDMPFFLEDCPSKDTRSAFVEYIHQVREGYMKLECLKMILKDDLFDKLDT